MGRGSSLTHNLTENKMKPDSTLHDLLGIDLYAAPRSTEVAIGWVHWLKVGCPRVPAPTAGIR